MYRNPPQVAFGEIYETNVNNNQLQRASHSYFFGDPSHDWNMSLWLIENYINYKKNTYTNNNKTLQRCFFFSDRSPKEFSCTGFLHGLNNISHKLSVALWWNFTSPHHGRWVHDATGGSDKTCINNGILEKQIDFTSSVPYETTIVNYLQNIRLNPNPNNISDDENDIKMNNNEINNNNNNNNIHNSRFKHNKTFHSVPNGIINHQKSELASLPDITKYFCFRTTNNINDNSIYYRYFSCFCNNCLNNKFNECKFVNYCGSWKKYVFINKKDKHGYCICNKNANYKKKYGMVSCDICDRWFHCYCLNINVKDVEGHDVEWKCPDCVENDDLI